MLFSIQVLCGHILRLGLFPPWACSTSMIGYPVVFWDNLCAEMYCYQPKPGISSRGTFTHCYNAQLRPSVTPECALRKPPHNSILFHKASAEYNDELKSLSAASRTVSIRFSELLLINNCWLCVYIASLDGEPRLNSLLVKVTV